MALTEKRQHKTSRQLLSELWGPQTTGYSLEASPSPPAPPSHPLPAPWAVRGWCPKSGLRASAPLRPPGRAARQESSDPAPQRRDYLGWVGTVRAIPALSSLSPIPKAEASSSAQRHSHWVTTGTKGDGNSSSFSLKCFLVCFKNAPSVPPSRCLKEAQLWCLRHQSDLKRRSWTQQLRLRVRAGEAAAARGDGASHCPPPARKGPSPQLPASRFLRAEGRTAPATRSLFYSQA